MAISNPFTMTVYNSAMRRQGTIGNPMAAEFTGRFNGQGSGQVWLKANDPILQKVLAPGARVVVEYRGEHFMSGPVRDPEGDFIVPNGQVLISIQDDWRRLVNTYAKVVPAAALAPASLSANGQANRPNGGVNTPGQIDGQSGYYLWPDGSAAAGGISVDSSEAAIKHIVQENLSRLPYTPLEVLPDLGRGGDALAAGILPEVRMLNLAEAVAPILAWSGLGLKVWQKPGGDKFSVDVWEPRIWTKSLSVESGIVQGGRWAIKSPEATRVIVGGPGELAARAFWDGGTDTANEALYGDVIEVFSDATGATLTWPESLDEALQVAKYYLLRSDVTTANKNAFRGYLNAAGTKVRKAGAPTSGLSISLSETDSFHYGGPTGYHLGDHLTAKSGTLEFSEAVTECKLSLTPTEGFKATLTVGEKQNDPNRQVARAIVSLATAMRQSNARK